MLIDTFYSYTHHPSLSLCRYYFAPFYQMHERLEKVTLLSKGIYAWECFLLTKKTQQILRLLLLCHICELQDKKIYNENRKNTKYIYIRLNELSSEFLPQSAQNSITIQDKPGEMKTV